MTLELDPRFTFETFVVGPANRLAAAAARSVADTPGSTYNPLFLYSGSGLGKTHLLTAVGHQVRRLHDRRVRYETLERLIEEISAAVQVGERDAVRGRLRGVDVLLLDDVQFLEGQRQLQEELIRAWDAVSGQGGQVVLSSDRAPQEIDDLDERLLTRLSGGLIVDIAAPDFETRVAIARRKADERGQTLAPEVYQALGRIAFSNVRELQGALNRLIAVQELERRPVLAEEVTAILGAAATERGRDEFGEFLAEITGTVGAVVDEAERRIAAAIVEWEGEGFRTRRLEAALGSGTTAAQAESLVERFGRDAARLREIEAEIRATDADAPELASPVLRDPDRVVEAGALLEAARERRRPPPAPPPGPSIDDLAGDALAVRAARAVVDGPGRAYNPFFALGPEGGARSSLLAAVGNGLRERHGAVVAYVNAERFAAELIEALEHSRLDIWRARYRRADALLVDRLEGLGGSERAQEELFHLFDEFQRDGRQLAFTAAAPPQDLPLHERLRTRLESGLVVELEPDASAAPAAATPGVREAGDEAASTAPAAAPAHPPARAGEAGAASGAEWIRGRETLDWEWPYPGDWIVEELG